MTEMEKMAIMGKDNNKRVQQLTQEVRGRIKEREGGRGRDLSAAAAIC